MNLKHFIKQFKTNKMTHTKILITNKINGSIMFEFEKEYKCLQEALEAAAKLLEEAVKINADLLRLDWSDFEGMKLKTTSDYNNKKI